jgi:hypothetical protein
VFVPIIVMGKECQNSKRGSYTAKFKCEVVQCVQKRNHTANAIFGVDESNVQL